VDPSGLCGVSSVGAALRKRLVVVVPSDALRTQIARGVRDARVLQNVGVIGPGALRPVVGQVQHAFTTVDSATELARHCNVLVTTPDALFASGPTATAALLDCCSHLFVG
jgi:hypothetical protein